MGCAHFWEQQYNHSSLDGVNIFLGHFPKLERNNHMFHSPHLRNYQLAEKNGDSEKGGFPSWTERTLSQDCLHFFIKKNLSLSPKFSFSQRYYQYTCVHVVVEYAETESAAARLKLPIFWIWTPKNIPDWREGKCCKNCPQKSAKHKQFSQVMVSTDS